MESLLFCLCEHSTVASPSSLFYLIASRDLLLGFRIIHDNGFSPEDYVYYKPLIFSNIITCMMQIIQGMDKLKIEFEDEERLVSACVCDS